MRQALNDNPKVQAVVIAVLIAAGIFMFMKMSGGEETGSATDPAVTAAGATGAGAVGATDPATAGVATGMVAPGATPAASPTAVGMPAAPVASTGSVPAEALVPGPGLPADVTRSYARGDAIVLLLVKEGATDDELVEDSVKRISRPGVSVFVAPASEVARYSRITQGVGVNRVPALIVVRPRRAGDSSPEATVSYGFRDLGSVLQAVEDARYRGRDDVPYHPG